MPLTRQEYDDLIARSDAGEICFMFDATQCKDFLLKLNNAEALSSTEYGGIGSGHGKYRIFYRIVLK
jgi:hypothetical protein